MTVLITGGLGFVGFHTARALAQRGERVVCFGLGQLPEYGTRELEPLTQQIIFVQGNVLDFAHLQDVVRAFQIDGIVHGAAIVQEKNCRANPLYACKVNIVGTLHVLELARTFKQRRVVYVGSGTQYPPTTGGRLIAETDPAHPKGMYGTTKQIAEDLATTWADVYDLPFVSARISSPYGPFERKTNPDPTHIQYWIKAGLQGKPCHIAHGGAHHRDYTYVEDTAEGLALIFSEPKLNHRVYNIASGKRHTLSDVVRVVRELIPQAAISIGGGFFDPATVGPIAPPRGALDRTRACKELGFAPKYNLLEGIKQYVTWLRQYQD